ncbi:MAG TPA: signal recognition particle-docking protein FtsY [Nitrososphaeraceae archaeon]|nr:signal recognition particle-docking protein FtsY [Nitrososphaeraceae archaeon]
MFEKLKKIFSETAKSLGQKSISKKEIDTIFDELQISLMENDVAQEIVDELTTKVKTEIQNLKLERSEDSAQVITTKLYSFLSDLFLSTNNKTDIIQTILEKKRSKAGPYSIIFLGINGTGKTTTVAKFCKLLRDNGISVVLAAADTHRAGAIEQITHHGNNLHVKVISQRYGADPSAVARDALEHARKNYIDAVLIDTAGRMQTSKNLMEEVSKIIRVIKPDMKIFVGDSLSGNDTVNQAREFFEYTNYDGSILTKSDADSKGGAAISIAYITRKPILYLGIGQGYDDLAEFDYDAFLDSIFKDRSFEKTNDNVKESKDDIFAQETLSYLPKTESQTDKDKIETVVPVTDKAVESDKLVAPSTIAATTNPVESDKDFSRSEFTNVEKKMSHTSNSNPKIEDKLVVQKKEIKVKKGSFLRFFKEKDDKQDEDQNDANKFKQNEDDDIKIKRDKETSKKIAESKSEDEVVYLTDDDIDDLNK